MLDEQKKKFDKVAYDNAFIANHYDRINLTVPKGKRDTIRSHAEAQGDSLNGYINKAIDEKMQRDIANEKGEP